ncbi:MAG: (2Fe-2S) ferredoxin domain-containing protein [Oscillatoriales cyanobacterium C42_A2020_001]|nr:(2Fe-2S) ferredoxin domain-containing protein [Leptolyngbyaceae cyanobacterium C42_A2020_001]
MSDFSSPGNCVWVCQNRTCKKQGALAVFHAFEALQLPGWAILKSQCMGQCGNGPMVRVLPGDIWYWRVQPKEVAAIGERHLLHGNPIQAMMYPPFVRG